MNNILEEEKNYTLEFYPKRVEDISHYKIGMPLFGEETSLVTNLTISDLVKRFSEYNSYPANEYLEKQVVMVSFSSGGEYCTNTNVWEHIHQMSFIPTFAFNYVSADTYDPIEETYEVSDFIFGYVLDKPITDKKLMNTILDYLSENIFYNFKDEYGIEVHNLTGWLWGPFENITEIYISNNIYVPVEGGLYNGKE